MGLPPYLSISELEGLLELGIVSLQDKLRIIVKLVKRGGRRGYTLLRMFLRTYGEPWIRYIRDGFKLVFIDDLNHESATRLYPQSQVLKEHI